MSGERLWSGPMARLTLAALAVLAVVVVVRWLS